MTKEFESKLNIIIISGFLGAGKTTFLQHYLTTFAGRTPHVLVNEVAEHSVDDFSLSSAKKVSRITGGCICCSKKSVFLEMLHSICNLRTHKTYLDSEQIERILIETSGVSNPESVYEGIINDRVLSKHVIVEKIIILIDAVSELNELCSEALIKEQILNADEIVISKCDLVEHKKIYNILGLLISLNPTAKINCSVKGEIKLMPIQSVEFKEIMLIPKRAEINTVEKIFTMKILLDSNTNWNSLVIWLSALLYCHGSRILRVKGVVSSPVGPLLLQGVGKYIQKPQRLPKTVETQEKYLILILRDMNRNDILSSIKYIYDK